MSPVTTTTLPEPERLVQGRATVNGGLNPYVSAQDYWDYRDLSTSFESLEAYVGHTDSYTITGVGEPERIAGQLVTVGLFPTLGVNPQLAESAMWSSGLEVLLAVFGITLIVVGALTVAAANRLDTNPSRKSDSIELDKFYYLKPRTR